MLSCYRPQKKLRKGNVFTPVCQSFCSQWEGVHPLGRHPNGQTPPRADTSQTVPAVDGRHPTGMHSCC